MSVFVSKQHTILARVTCPRCQGRHTSQQCPTLRDNPPAKRKKRTKVRKYRPSSKPDDSLPSDARGWFTKLYPLIRWSIRRKLMNQPEYKRDDMLANALAFSWPAFQRTYAKRKDTLPPVDIARIAAYLAVKTVCHRGGTEYASTRERGWVDALDARFQRETVDLGLFPAPLSARTPAYDTQDMSKAIEVISRMPDSLKPLAFCLAANADMRALVRSAIGDAAQATGELTQREIAAYMGCSVRTIQLRAAELRAWCAVDAEPTNRVLAQTLADWLGE